MEAAVEDGGEIGAVVDDERGAGLSRHGRDPLENRDAFPVERGLVPELQNACAAFERSFSECQRVGAAR